MLIPFLCSHVGTIVDMSSPRLCRDTTCRAIKAHGHHGHGGLILGTTAVHGPVGTNQTGTHQAMAIGHGSPGSPDTLAAGRNHAVLATGNASWPDQMQKAKADIKGRRRRKARRRRK